ncbi:unnamed protein product, partial [Polarella glacialis]
MAPGVDPVEDFVRQRHLDAHKRKVARSQSTISTRWEVREESKLLPRRQNPKKEQLMEDRFSNIERENMRLLNRMQEIEHKGVSGAPACAGTAPARSSSVRSAAGSR